MLYTLTEAMVRCWASPGDDATTAGAHGLLSRTS